MDIRFHCPRCGQTLCVEERGAGMRVNCPSCKEQIEIPRSTAAEALKVSVPRIQSGPPPLPPTPQSLPIQLNPKPERATYDASTNTFKGAMPQVFKLAMRAVQEVGWTLVNVNDTLGLVTFDTGMTSGSWSGVSGSLTIMELSENQFRVSGTGEQNVRGGQFLALDFGEAQGEVNKVLDKMRELAK